MQAARRERLVQLSHGLAVAQRPIRVLRSIAWGPEVAKQFFADGARELPRPTYHIDSGVAAAVETLTAMAGGADRQDPAQDLIARTAESIANAGRMLLAIGTPEFYELSRDTYGGDPNAATVDPRISNLALAEHLAKFCETHESTDLGGPPESVLPAEVAAAELRKRFDKFFGDDAPEVRVAPSLSARAVAGPRMVRIRARTGFSEAEVTRLEHHEGYVHVATTLNGARQPVLPSLASASPRSVSEQEGLAVFAELQAGTFDLERVRNLADRVIAIRMSREGASFLDLYAYFRERVATEEEAFEAARRIVRGGLIAGGAPFTKDGCYLEGLLLIYCLIRRALARGRPDFVRWLFAGKIDITDLPVLSILHHEGVVLAPRYLAPWAADQRFLAAQMSFSDFLGETDYGAWRAYSDRLLNQTSFEPRARMSSRPPPSAKP